ncbi:MAG: transcription-repair coupling factor [Deltaproteobacteria bacterium]|nr:transcription-repair coupling factor [Deltaproteobacteria bacterium]
MSLPLLKERLTQASTLALVGCQPSHLCLLLAQLAAERPLLVVTADDETARRLASDLRFFGHSLSNATKASTIRDLPALESSPYHDVAPDRAAMIRRSTALFQLALDGRGLANGGVLVASANALRRRVLPKSEFIARSRTVSAGQELDRDQLIADLDRAGYVRMPVVEDPATYAVRGGLVDLYLPDQRYPARVEFFGDEVDSIRLFAPDSQRTLRQIDALCFGPTRDTIVTAEDGLRQRLLAAADAAHLPSRATKAILEALDQGRDFIGIEALLPCLHDQLGTVFDFLSEDLLPVTVDPDGIDNALRAADAHDQLAYAARISDNRIAFPPDQLFLTADEIAERLARPNRLIVPQGSQVAASELLQLASRDNAELARRLARARAGKGEELLAALAAQLNAWLEQDFAATIALATPTQAERLRALLADYQIDCQVRRERDGQQSAAVTLRIGELTAGFVLDEAREAFLTESEIFGPRRGPARSRRAAGQATRSIADLRDINEGDLIVHSLHGIGIYRGMQKMSIGATVGDYLTLEYAGGDKLYLPIYRLDQVHRYIAEGHPKKLDRLGGQTWLRKKHKVQGAVREYSEQLLQLYAQRAALDGHAYPAPDATFSEFEASFPFSETPDQLQAVEQVMSDLQSPQPADRLICGDVGFGKTEVALRAAFHAAISGRQVAVLAPTTVLVEQHARTFTERMAAYPLKVESLSRFRGPKESRRIIQQLSEGKVDVVIGTHRLLSSDVRFSDLGLLIIDEEQRFGVAHKEKLKRYRTQVDVLTLTATPIPRTMQMAMIGLREISVISTPPAERLAVRTLITHFENNTIIDAARREIDRGGQIFFVHNRVHDIDQWAGRLRELLPFARIGVAHGQMESRRLERVMLSFVQGEFDLLVCTTIIESGLDIPRANTMFVNHADRYGLAQLYQLRGRIGRSRLRAYCYLLVDAVETLSDEGRARLSTLQRFSELGSGFSVASHDMELRGAGDLLGQRQSGHIAAVGFETYARILEEAVAELKGQPITQASDPELNICVPAYIPDDYVEDAGQRLEFYQRLSCAARDENMILSLLDELRDRYGERPREVDALGEVMVLKGLATQIAARVVDLSPGRLTLTFEQDAPLAAEDIASLVSTPDSRYALRPPSRLIYRLAEAEKGAPLAVARDVLHALAARTTRSPN